MHKIMLLGVAALLVIGCQSSLVYKVKVRPNDTGFEREISVTYMPGIQVTEVDGKKVLKTALPGKEVRDHLTAVYGKQPQTVGQSYVVSGSFRHTVPADVDGSGRYQVFKSELGTAYTYVETSGNAADSWPSIARTIASSERLADAYGGFLGNQLKGDPNFNRFRVFLQKELKADLNNLTFFFLARAIAEQQTPSTSEEMAQKKFSTAIHRAGLYLVTARSRNSRVFSKTIRAIRLLTENVLLGLPNAFYQERWDTPKEPFLNLLISWTTSALWRRHSRSTCQPQKFIGSSISSIPRRNQTICWSRILNVSCTYSFRSARLQT